MSIFKRKKVEQIQEVIEPKDYKLYILIDSEKTGIIQYFEENGISISKLFHDLSSIKISLMVEVLPTRLVIIDTGTGLFSSKENIADIIDLLGMVELSEDKKATFVYTDKILKSAVQKQKYSIDMVEYISTAYIIDELNSHKEEIYNQKGEEDKTIDDKLQYIGNRTYKDENKREPEHGLFDILEQLDAIGDIENSIEVYKIKV